METPDLEDSHVFREMEETIEPRSMNPPGREVLCFLESPMNGSDRSIESLSMFPPSFIERLPIDDLLERKYLLEIGSECLSDLFILFRMLKYI